MLTWFSGWVSSNPCPARRSDPAYAIWKARQHPEGPTNYARRLLRPWRKEGWPRPIAPMWYSISVSAVLGSRHNSCLSHARSVQGRHEMVRALNRWINGSSAALDPVMEVGSLLGVACQFAESATQGFRSHVALLLAQKISLQTRYVHSLPVRHRNPLKARRRGAGCRIEKGHSVLGHHRTDCWTRHENPDREPWLMTRQFCFALPDGGR
jgi:hypothetical protein